jgi:hypothetical protein
VELKAEWPNDPEKAARRLAGHANAALGERILWLIGVDEKGHTIPGASHSETATWFDQMKRCFDGGVYPDLTDVSFTHGAVTVVALAFETGRAPYLVKNPGGGAFQRDIPWREGTRVDSATREQLLRILLPPTKLPLIELVRAEAHAEASGDRVQFTIQQSFFIEQPPEQLTTVPIHRCSVKAKAGAIVLDGPCVQLAFHNITSEHLRCSEDLMIAKGSGYFRTTYKHRAPREPKRDFFKDLRKLTLEVSSSFGISTTDRSVTVESAIPPKADCHNQPEWAMSRFGFLDHPTPPPIEIG